MNVSKHKLKPLNMNVYRNLHFHSLNYQKQAFSDTMKPLLQGLPQMEGVTLEYEIFPQSKRLFDVVNIGSIVDKYFSDSLVKFGVIPDDNYTYLPKVIFTFGGYVVEDEYVLVTINETKTKKEKDMRILLDEDEVSKALTDFVETLGLSGVTGVKLSTNDDGDVIAEILLGEVVTKPIKKTRGGRPVGSKNKPKESVENVAETVNDSIFGDDTGIGESTEEETESDSKTTKEGKKSKNSSKDTQESSEGDPKEEKASKPKVKKTSIFDDDDDDD